MNFDVRSFQLSFLSIVRFSLVIKKSSLLIIKPYKEVIVCRISNSRTKTTILNDRQLECGEHDYNQRE